MGRGGGEAVVMKGVLGFERFERKSWEIVGSGCINRRSEGVSRCRRWA